MLGKENLGGKDGPEQTETDEEPLSLGERPDEPTKNLLNLVHRVVDKFPDLKKEKRFRQFAGPVAIVSTGLIVLAAIAVARRLEKGQSGEDILDGITAEEIRGSVKLTQEEDEEE